MKENKNRESIVIRTSITGILVNVLLAAFKAAIGLLSNSIAVILDAVNNLSDALSSVITIIGTKLAARKPDRKHPLGYGRVEYLSAMIVSAIILYAGITSAVESVKKIIHPETPDYSILSLVIIAVAVLAKVLLGRFVKKQGEKAGSAALSASGSDALFDAILSFSVLVCAVIFLLTKLPLEPYVGIVISGFIIKAGIEMMLDTLNDLVGKRTDADLVRKIKEVILKEPEVLGAYDLIVFNFGPEKDFASVHLEIPDTMTADMVDGLTRRVQENVYQETGIILTGVSMYSFNTKNEKAKTLREEIRSLVMKHDFALQFHGFYMDEEKKYIRFDVVMSFDTDLKDALKILYEEIKPLCPGYELVITPDVDITDL